MRPFRIIPILALEGMKLVKTTRYLEPKYLGDPINTIRIFNDKEVDELCILDIRASRNGRPPNLQFMARMVNESFMPLAYGGGITTLDEIRNLLKIGVEKVVLGAVAARNPDFVRQAADTFGSSTIIVSVDSRKRWWGGIRASFLSARRSTHLDPLAFALKMEALGAGEILFNDVDRDGMRVGMNQTRIREFSNALSIPLIASCGAAKVDDLVESCVKGGANAAAASGIFVYQGPHRAVLISYPTEGDLTQAAKRLSTGEQ